jgi:predicted lipoprotein with Yx(FWY)xxD motif
MQLEPLARVVARVHKPALAAAAASLIALAVAACGGSSSSDTSSSAGATTSSGDTVSTKSFSGVGDVLVDSQGAALYTNDMDSGSKIACTTSCTAIWVPLAAPSGGQPTSSESSIESELGTVKRPDGTTQVTYEGKPLYSFVQDHPGQATGNGVTDSFAGTDFTWTAATAGGTSSGSTGTTGTSTPSSGGGYGGY